ncbi:MAG: signal peptidase I [Desulfurococcaceae archaeon]|nr:signal peptidase I [Desulfurococcaceae archaeon]
MRSSRRRSRVVKVLRVVARVVEVVLGVLAVALLVLMALGYVTLAVIEGTSMEPTLQTGDVVVVVRGVKPGELSVGDIVVYRRGSSLIIHRVVSLGPFGIVTKGDNNWAPDPPVPYEAVVGKVLNVGGATFRVPLVGYLTLLIRYSATSRAYLPVLLSFSSVLR